MTEQTDHPPLPELYEVLTRILVGISDEDMEPVSFGITLFKIAEDRWMAIGIQRPPEGEPFDESTGIVKASSDSAADAASLVFKEILVRREVGSTIRPVDLKRQPDRGNDLT